MKTIQLFHSYNYVNGKFRQHNKYIYDENNKLLFSLLNIPNNSDLYTIKLQRILKKKKFSLKKNNNSHYTKHNLKIFLIVNYNQLNHYISNNLDIPQFRLLYNIIINNIYINKNEYIHNLICFNKSFKKKILTGQSSIVNNFNFYKLNNLSLDILSKKIIPKNKIIYKKYIVNGKIIYYDIFSKLVEELLDLKLQNTLFICSKSKLKQYNYANFISSDKLKQNKLKQNKLWDNIIILDHKVDVKNLNCYNLYICVNKLHNIRISEVLDIYDYFFNINFKKYILNSKLVLNILECVIFRNYSYKLFKLNTINILENNSLYINKFSVTEKNITNSLCHICFSNNINIETSCKHYFCYSCVEKMLNKNKIICPHCRKINNIGNLSYLVNSKSDILTNKINICDQLKYVLKKISKSQFIILSNNDKKIKYIKDISKFLDITPNIYNINSKFNCTKYNILCLEPRINYNLIELFNLLIENGYTKSFTLTFF